MCSSAGIGASTSLRFSAFLNGRYLPADLRGDITVNYNSPTGKRANLTHTLNRPDHLWRTAAAGRKCVLFPVKPSSSPCLLQASVSRPCNISGIDYFPLQTNKTTLYFKCHRHPLLKYRFHNSEEQLIKTLLFLHAIVSLGFHLLWQASAGATGSPP